MNEFLSMLQEKKGCFIIIIITNTYPILHNKIQRFEFYQSCFKKIIMVILYNNKQHNKKPKKNLDTILHTYKCDTHNLIDNTGHLQNLQTTEFKETSVSFRHSIG